MHETISLTPFGACNTFTWGVTYVYIAYILFIEDYWFDDSEHFKADPDPKLAFLYENMQSTNDAFFTKPFSDIQMQWSKPDYSFFKFSFIKTGGRIVTNVFSQIRQIGIFFEGNKFRSVML